MNLKYRRTFHEIIPYSTQVADGVVLTKNRQYLASWEFSGSLFECTDEIDLSVLNEQIHNFLKTIASDQVHFYHHLVRNSFQDSLDYISGNYFADKIGKIYYEDLNKSQLRRNKIYFTLVYSSNNRQAIKVHQTVKDITKQNLSEGQKALSIVGELIEKINSFVKRIGGTQLKTYIKNEVTYSKQLEFYNFLISGSNIAVPLLDSRISNILGTSDVYFKGEMCEIHTGQKRLYAKSIEIKEMPSSTSQNIFDALLVSDCDFVLTQSFSPILKRRAISLLNLSAKRLKVANDDAKSQQDDLDEAKDNIASGGIFFGNYHFSLMVFGDSIEQTRKSSNKMLNIMSDIGFVAVFAKFSLIASFCAQLPCVFDLRPRLIPLSSKNFVDMGTFHNFELGKKDKNCWGQALCLLKTASRGGYFFNLHDGVKGKDEFGLKNLGNTSVIGVAGSGKTMLLSFMQISFQKYGVTNSFDASSSNKQLTTIFLDKDRGAELNIRALGGKYYIFKAGMPTGWNPFQIESTEANRAFLKDLIKLLTRQEAPHSPRELECISNCVDSVLSMPKQSRVFGISRCLENLNKSIGKDAKENDLSVRLARWSKDGEFGWVFDNEVDSFQIDKHTNFGFDGTQFLDHVELRNPISFYLLHRINQILDGRRAVIFLDEFWKWISDPVFADFAYNKLKTIRKLNALLIAATQSPDEILKSDISRAVVESCSTQIFLANPRANKDDYISGFKVTEKEFEIIKNLDPSSRSFLIKKSSISGDTRSFSALVKLDLKAIGNYTKILSTNMDNLRIFEGIYKDGLEPQEWIPQFLELAI